MGSEARWAGLKIEAMDVFYLAMPRIEDIGDGSQDACVVRVAAGGHVGWGECKAAPRGFVRSDEALLIPS